MCDKPHFEKLDDRVDVLENRITKVETSLEDIKTQVASGFADLKGELKSIHEEKAKWGEWARDNLGRALKWAGIIILAACGITQAGHIIDAVNVCVKGL